MKRSFDNFALVDSGLANNRNSVPYLNASGDPFGTPVEGLPTDTTYNPTWVDPLTSSYIPPATTNMDVLQTYTAGQQTSSGGFLSSLTAQGELVIPPTYTSGQQTSSGSFLSNLTAQELNTLGQTVGGLTAAILQIRQQSQQARTLEEQQRLQAEALELERQRIEAMNALADAQRRAGVPVTAEQGLSTGAIIGIVAGGVLVLGLIMFLAFRQK
jgi:hypothetical protein